MIAVVVKTGLRTTTYKLATMAAIIDFSLSHGPARPGGELDIPISELARRVMAIYWEQSRPFNGVRLRQSFTEGALIIDSVEKLRSAAGASDSALTLEFAERLAPELYSRTLGEVGLCLARQPLSRLQRPGGYEKTVPFLYDDSFLHDDITPVRLKYHGDAIRLKPGVAEGLAMNRDRISRLLQTVWVEDVLRMNKMSKDERTRVESHLFGRLEVRSAEPKPADQKSDSTTVGESPTSTRPQPSTTTVATRLNKLIAALPNYSSGEVAAKIRRGGYPMTVSALINLQAAVGPPPSTQAIKALADHFGVDPSYFFDSRGSNDAATSAAINRGSTPSDEPKPASTPSSDPPTKPDTQGVVVNHGESWGRVFTDDLEDIAAACAVRDNGCWLAPSNTPVPCRHSGDLRTAQDLPRMALYRWAWMVDHGCAQFAIPKDAIHIKRSCRGWTCCNPQHLSATSPSGSPLSKTTLDKLIQNHSPRSAKVVEPQGTTVRKERLVLPADVDSIRNLCSLDKAGCWIPPSVGPIACRPEGDERDVSELPMMASHRWVWMVAHGRATNPLPADFHVRRRCGNQTCCRPDHLYLCTPQGRGVTLEVAEALLRIRRGKGESESNDGGKHRKPEVDNEVRIENSRTSKARFASRLNRLFETTVLPGDVPCTSKEVAATLQGDSIAISEGQIDRLRSGQGDPPDIQMIEALAYVFDVGAEYFSDNPPSSIQEETPETDIPFNSTQVSTAPSASAEAPIIAISVDELGQLVKGLSETVSDCLAEEPAQIQTVAELAPLLAEIGALLSEGDLLIDRSVLQRIITKWNTSAQRAQHKEIVARLHRLVNDDYFS